MDLKPLKIEADLMWAFLDTPNQMSGKYQVDLCNLSKPAIKALEEVELQRLEYQMQMVQHILLDHLEVVPLVHG